MASDTYFTGYEHKTVSAASGALFDSITGSPVISQNASRTGQWSFRCAPVGVAERAGWDLSSTTTSQGTIQHYIFFTSVPSGSCMLSFAVAADATRPGLYFNSSSGKFEFGYAGFTAVDTGVTVQSHVWYRIDYQVEFVTGAMRIKGRINNGADKIAWGDIVETNITGFRMGTTQAETYTAYYDDVSYDLSVATFPLPHYRVFPVLPSADGTHNAGTNVIEDDTGADIGVVTAFDKIQSFTDSTNYLRQAANGTGNYAEILLTDLNTTLDQLTFDGVIGYAWWAGAGNPTCTAATYVVKSDASVGGIYGTPSALTDYSTTGGDYSRAVITPVTSWSRSEINSLKIRFGNSGDANPDPYLYAAMLECRAKDDGVDFPYIIGATATTDTASGASAGSHAIATPTSFEPGDLWLVFTATNLADHTSHTMTSATRLSSANNSGTSMDYGVWGRRYAAGDGAFGTISFSHGGACTAAWSAIIVKNWKDSTLADWVAWSSSSEGTNLNTADTSSLTPGSKWATDDTLWFSFIGAVGSISTISAVPTNYENVLSASKDGDYSSSSTASAIVAFREVNTATENPGSWTSSSASVSWMGITVAVAPVNATAGAAFVEGIAAFAGSGAAVLAGSAIRDALAAYAGSASVVPAGSLLFEGASAWTASGSATMQGSKIHDALAAYSGTGSAVFLQDLLIGGASTLAGSGSVVVTSDVIFGGVAAFGGTSTSVFLADLTLDALASWAGTGAVVMAGELGGIQEGVIALLGSGAVLAGGSVLLSPSETAFSSTGAAIFGGSLLFDLASTMAGTGATTLVSDLLIGGSSTFAGAGTLVPGASIIADGISSLLGTGALAPGASIENSGVLSVAGAGTWASDGTLFLGTNGTFAGAGSVAAIPDLILDALIALTGQGDLVAEGTVTAVGFVDGAVVLLGAGGIIVVPSVTFSAAASIAGTGAWTAVGTNFKNASSSLAGVSTLAPVPSIIAEGTANLPGTGAIISAANVIIVSAISLNGAGTLVGDLTLIPVGGPITEPFVARGVYDVLIDRVVERRYNRLSRRGRGRR